MHGINIVTACVFYLYDRMFSQDTLQFPLEHVIEDDLFSWTSIERQLVPIELFHVNKQS
jgi:hypothetical protein